ncbi:hypothetical protein SDC9_118847 [bioreactor metagenome]|uniref:Uncharacterized protein n=1 Tax=bioreactor metagenome TaxID=1076179 RepID=A0A645C223_9ZZZZ
MTGDGLGGQRLGVQPPPAAELRPVGAEDLLVNPGQGQAHPVALAVDGRKVAGRHQKAPLQIPAQKDDAVAVFIVRTDPFKALPRKVVFPQGPAPQVEGVGRPEEGVQLPVLFLLQQRPVQLALKMPFVYLTQLSPHEQQLLARMGQHIAVKHPHPGELQGLLPGHFAQKRALHVHHLIVGKGEQEALGKGVHE